MSDKKSNKKRFGFCRKLAFQVAVFFLIGVILTVALSVTTLVKIADRNVIAEKENLSAHISTEVDLMFKEFDAYRWALNYALEHRDDPEFEVEYDNNELTAVKKSTLSAHRPGIVFNKVTESEINTFAEEDQRLLAEIIYNDWLCRMNDIMKSYGVCYFYILALDDVCDQSIFVLSASEGLKPRSTKWGDAYILGTTVDNLPEQRDAFRLLSTGDHIVYTEGYVDRYHYLYRIKDVNYVVGMTFEIGEVKREAENQSMQSVVLFALLQLFLSCVCLLLIYMFVINHVNTLKKSVYQYMDEKNGVNARKSLKKVTAKNEIGELAVAFSDMTSEMDEHVEEIKSITAEKERIGAELNVATKIQADMLPNIFPAFPNINSFEVYATMNPAKEVGGDFYDFFIVDDDHVALVIADVSGKGVPAALFMVIAKTIIKNRTLLGGMPSEILYDVNNQLCDGNASGYFVSVWLAIINIRTGKGYSVNAGHEHPIIRRAGGQYEYVKYPHAPVVAALEEIRFKEREFLLKPGDRIVVYTDGVPEATNANNELFGPDRTLDSLNREPDASQLDLLTNLQNDINDFVGDAVQFDDITLLVFDYHGGEDGKGKD